MTMGKFAVVVLLLSGLIAGGAMYYAQVYGYYDTLEPQIGYQVEVADGSARLSISDFEGIDSTSSPLRYRACFTIVGAQPDFIAYPDADPLNGPGWFDCFDAPTIGADLASGAARGVLVEANFRYGFDYVMALYPDGRAKVWPQINACGAPFFDGDPVPPGCPPPPADATPDR